MDQQKQAFNPLLAVLAALAALFFVFPLIGMITGAPWGNVFGIITSKSSLDALGLSIIASLASTVIALLFGFPLAWMLARNHFRGKAVVRGLTTLPMVLPPVVGGIALLLAYGRRRFIGQPLDKAFGISPPFTLAGVIVAESFVAMPFFVITVESGRHGPGRPRPAHQGPTREPAHRPDVPGLPAVPAPERGGERGVRPAGQGHRQEDRAG